MVVFSEHKTTSSVNKEGSYNSLIKPNLKLNQSDIESEGCEAYGVINTS